MYISAFSEHVHTSIDTVKYYIKLGLLEPSKKNNWYFFTNTDLEDFKMITDLKDLGLSLAGISKIKLVHDHHCSTPLQWQHNLAIITDELTTVNQELEVLSLRQKKLSTIKRQLENKIKKV